MTDRRVRAMAEPTQVELNAFILRAGFRAGWENLESWARRMAEQAVREINEARAMHAAQPAVAQQPGAWVPLPGTLPDPGKPVLLDIGEKYPIRAMWAAKHTIEVGMEDDSKLGEYDEATDTYYCPEGWYEWNEQEERHWLVDKTPVAWCELPTKTGTAQPAPQQAQEPVAWYVTGCGRLLDENEAKAEARHIGGTARAIPLYTAPQADSVTAPAGGADWQDISTAPKDGTRFVAVGQNYGLDSEKQHTCIAQRLAGCWVEVSDWNGASKLKYLTHWMPLPPLPGNAARKQGENHD